MTVQRKADIGGYSEQEKRTLLTGVPLSPVSTRFGHPFRGGWNVPEIRRAWNLLSDELLARWRAPEFARYRERGRPFAERTLADE